MAHVAPVADTAADAVRPVAQMPGLVALALGFVFVLGVGFSHVSAAHNAAHDARHAAGFPCH